MVYVVISLKKYSTVRFLMVSNVCYPKNIRTSAIALQQFLLIISCVIGTTV